MWKMSSSMRYILFGSGFVWALTTVQIVNAQEAATCVEWGEYKECPELGVNTRLLREHPEPDCMQPEFAPWRYDWNSADLRRDVADLHPKVLRFPGGTVGNYWWWTNETRQIIGNDGAMHQVDMCEASTIGLSESLFIGCNGLNLDFTSDRYNDVVKKTTITLESFKEAVTHFKEEEGLNIQEMFMISILDPFYYIGSPHLEAICPDASYEVIRDTIMNNSILRAELQLDKILEVYCGGCASSDEIFDFELGNESYLQRYGKYFPRPECIDMANVCNDCYPDISLYADICEALIPMVRQRFPNSRVSVSATRDILHLPWNQVLIDRFGSGPIQIDAAVMHYYPKSMDLDSLNANVCTSVSGSYDPDRVLHYQQKAIRDITEQKRLDLFEGTGIDIWITEFNNYDFTEDCASQFAAQMNADDFVFDSGNWIHTLSIMNLYNEFIGYNSNVSDPWMNSSKNLHLTKLCMQVMYGNNRVAAIRDDRKLSAQGMAIETLMLLNNSATGIKRLLIGPTDNFSFNAEGAWSPSPTLEGPLPYTFELDYMDDDDQPATMLTWDTFGFLYQTDEGPKVLLVNLKSSPLSVDMSHVESFEEGAHCVNRKVPQNKLNEALLNEHSSPQIQTLIADVASSNVVIPPYSICILDGIPFMASGLEDEYAFSADDVLIFPNPSESQVTVRLNSNIHQANFKLMDVTGKVLTSSTEQATEKTFDLSSFQNGMYFMEIQVGQQRKMKPLVIQR